MQLSEPQVIRASKAELKDERKSALQHLENRLPVIEGDIRSFHSKIGNHDGRLEAVERQQQRTSAPGSAQPSFA